jgi:DNA replication licensing factor MCM4
LQLFGGTKKNFTDAGQKTCRSGINILLCGDHGIVKSELQEYVCRLVARAQYINGKGTHADRLTVYVTGDRETGQGVLQT